MTIMTPRMHGLLCLSIWASFERKDRWERAGMAGRKERLEEQIEEGRRQASEELS